MVDPYLEFVAGFAHAMRRGSAITHSLAQAPVVAPWAAGASVCLIFSPHPDDEVIAGALPWRLRSEDGWRVVNIAVTLGSDVTRRAARWQELGQACAYLGFELHSASGKPGEAFERVRPREFSSADAAGRDAEVAQIAALIRQYRPRVLVCPHALDGHPAHMGTHDLVLDALRSLSPDWRLHVLFSEYWNTQINPGLMVPLDVQQVSSLVAALALHAGEVARNPYHLGLPAWFMDSARRGAERVGPAGGPATGAVFAALYGWSCWHDGALTAMPGRIAPAGSVMGAFFD